MMKLLKQKEGFESNHVCPYTKRKKYFIDAEFEDFWNIEFILNIKQVVFVSEFKDFSKALDLKLELLISNLLKM